jgi:hypothetical protein
LFTLFRNANRVLTRRLRKQLAMGPRDATCDPSRRSECEGRAGQAAVSPARLRRARIVGLPSPHHATRALASEEMPSHLMMQAWEKHSIQHVFEPAFGTRIGAIEGKWPFLPAKPDHGAPFLHHRIFFSHEHWTFSIHMTGT